MIPELELVVWEVMELVSVRVIFNGDIGEYYLAIEALTDRVIFTVFSSLIAFLLCKFWEIFVVCN